MKELGSGSFGRVIKVRKGKSDKEVYAMKQIKMMQLNAREKDNALNEVRLLASIDSPNIISYKSAFFEEFGSTLCILMEYADGGDLAVLASSPRDSSNARSKSINASAKTSSGRLPTTSFADSRSFMPTTSSTAISNLPMYFSWEGSRKLGILMFQRC